MLHAFVTPNVMYDLAGGAIHQCFSCHDLITVCRMLQMKEEAFTPLLLLHIQLSLPWVELVMTQTASHSFNLLIQKSLQLNLTVTVYLDITYAN